MFGVWGCAPDPELVSVDLTAIDLVSAPSIDAAGPEGLGPIQYSAEIPDLAAQDVYIGSAEDRAVEALDIFRKAQQQATEAVLNRLKNAYLTEATVFETTEKTALDEEYRQWIDSAMADLHAAFQTHAEQVEPLRYRLTAIVGFPDPDPESVKVPLESNERATRNYEAAKALREQIKALREAYREDVDRRLRTIAARREQRLNEIGTRTEVLRQDAVRRAQAEADAVSQVALAELERTALDPEATLSAVPGASSSVNSAGAPQGQTGGQGVPGETMADVEGQLQVFLKVHGYRLSKGGRDATQEFLDWRRKYTAGR